VQLVDYDVAQVLEIAGPAGVVRKDAAVQHVGIGEHHVGLLPDGLAGVLRSVAIVGEGANLRAHGFHRRLEFVQLVLGQRLGGEHVHGARALVGEQQIQHRQVVAQRLPAGRGRDHHGIAAGGGMIEGIRLVGVEAGDAAFFERRLQPRVHSGRNIRKRSFGGSLVVNGANRRIRLLMHRPETGDHGFERGFRGYRQLLGEFGKSEREIHVCAFAFSLLWYNTKRAARQPCPTAI
jgi:hypothetical protein